MQYGSGFMAMEKIFFGWIGLNLNNQILSVMRTEPVSNQVTKIARSTYSPGNNLRLITSMLSQ